ncbi:MAG: ankyrin repeat domain-containing protein [Rhizomicrobium sp.]
MTRLPIYWAAVSLILLFSPAMGAEHLVAGRSASEQFNDPQVAALAEAACAGDISGVDRLIHSGVSPNSRGRQGETALIWAVWCGNLAGVEGLLKNGGNPNYVVPHQNSATYAAATSHDPALLKLLLKYGGDPNAYAKDDPGNSALFRAEILIENGYGWDNFHALLAAGANVNQVGSTGRSVAFYAALGREYGAVAELLGHGYSRNLPQLAEMVASQPFGGSRATEIAAERAKVLEMLKQQGVAIPMSTKNSIRY